MLRLIALTTLLASPARAQFADTPWLKDSLAAIHLQSQTLQTQMAANAPPDVSKYPIRGIDVSRYQKTIDWTKLNSDGLSFVFIEATHGLSFVDEQFQANWKGSATTNIPRSAYHFYDFCKTGSAQADYFIKAVPKDDNLLPMVIDLEQNDLCKKMPDRDAFRKQLAAFVTKVTARYGLKPILYINYSIYDQYLKGADDGYKLWIADPRSKSPNMPDNQSWAFWQYDWHGKIAGLDEEVDLDVFNGTPEMLASLKQPAGVMYASLK